MKCQYATMPELKSCEKDATRKVWNINNPDNVVHMCDEHASLNTQASSGIKAERLRYAKGDKMSDCSQEFVDSFNLLKERVHDYTRRAGFWDEGNERSDGELIALMHSELSEALEALRAGNPADDKIPEFNGYEAELADCIIRIMDAAAAKGLRVGEAIVAKMAANEGRPYRHGKEF